MNNLNSSTLDPMTRWDDLAITAVDIETCGLHLDDGIVEVGIVQLWPDGLVDGFRALVNPGKPIPEKATAIHGITDAMVADAPTLDEVCEEIKQWLRAANVVVAHNMAFDWPRLAYGIGPACLPTDTPTLCTMVLARRLGYKPANLGAVATKLGIEIGQAHRATDDALAAAQIARRFTAGKTLASMTSGPARRWL